MKLKLAFLAFFTAFSILFFHLLVFPTIVVKVATNAPETKIVLEYKNDVGVLTKIPMVTASNGKTDFIIPIKKLSGFEIFIPKPYKLDSVVVKSGKKQKLDIPTLNRFKNLSIRGTNLLGLRLFLLAEFLWAITCFMLLKLATSKSFELSERTGGKLLNIEFLRVFFTLGVVCSHFFLHDLHLKNFGGVGVEFFFILSGYFLSLTFRSNLSTLDFIKKKVIVWLPLIMFGSILCGGYLSCFKDIFFLQSTGLAYIDITNEPAWYLGVLMWVLVLYFYMLKTLSRPQCNLIIGIISFFSYVLCAQNNGLRTMIVFSYFPLNLFRGLAGVGAGYLLAQFCLRENLSERKTSYKLWTIFEIFAMTWVVLKIFVCQIPSEWIFSPICFILIIYLFVRKKGLLTNMLEHPFWSFASRYCLAVYLTHTGVIGIFEKYASLYGQWALNHKIFAINIVLITCVLIGIFSYHVIQKPAEKFLKDHWR